jgi:hypothetical protein
MLSRRANACVKREPGPLNTPFASISRTPSSSSCRLSSSAVRRSFHSASTTTKPSSREPSASVSLAPSRRADGTSGARQERSPQLGRWASPSTRSHLRSRPGTGKPSAARPKSPINRTNRRGGGSIRWSPRHAPLGLGPQPHPGSVCAVRSYRSLFGRICRWTRATTAGRSRAQQSGRRERCSLWHPVAQWGDLGSAAHLRRTPRRDPALRMACTDLGSHARAMPTGFGRQPPAALRVRGRDRCQADRLGGVCSAATPGLSRIRRTPGVITGFRRL